MPRRPPLVTPAGARVVHQHTTHGLGGDGEKLAPLRRRRGVLPAELEVRLVDQGGWLQRVTTAFLFEQPRSHPSQLAEYDDERLLQRVVIPIPGGDQKAGEVVGLRDGIGQENGNCKAWRGTGFSPANSVPSATGDHPDANEVENLEAAQVVAMVWALHAPQTTSQPNLPNESSGGGSPHAEPGTAKNRAPRPLRALGIRTWGTTSGLQSNVTSTPRRADRAHRGSRDLLTLPSSFQQA